jgi:TPP-dependent trihydroxycyclohexane-1,2-dione (THcHDO) dehydratase
MGQADLVLAFGASLNDWTTRAGGLFETSAHVIHCDVNQAAIGALTWRAAALRAEVFVPRPSWKQLPGTACMKRRSGPPG